MKRTTIDLNADIGEIPDRIRSGVDDLLMACLSSANVACGGHAGDAVTMEASVASALRYGVAVGAHVAYPDREGFGRRDLSIAPETLLDAIRRQVDALEEACRRYGTRVAHVKPHGALYHRTARDPDAARLLARALEPYVGVLLVGLAGSSALRVWREAGREVVAEGFADRLYAPDGSLVPRSIPGSVMALAGEAAEQALRIAEGRGVVAIDGAVVAVEADTIGLHGDGPNPIGIARETRAILERAGIRIASPRR